jgi:hypothetical protein
MEFDSGFGKREIPNQVPRLFSMMEQTKQLFQRRIIYLMYVVLKEKKHDDLCRTPYYLEKKDFHFLLQRVA